MNKIEQSRLFSSWLLVAIFENGFRWYQNILFKVLKHFFESCRVSRLKSWVTPKYWVLHYVQQNSLAMDIKKLSYNFENEHDKIYKASSKPLSETISVRLYPNSKKIKMSNLLRHWHWLFQKIQCYKKNSKTFKCINFAFFDVLNSVASRRPAAMITFEFSPLILRAWLTTLSE